MRARRVDANHGKIIAAFRERGCYVLDLSGVGKGCPDILVSDGINVLVEIKTDEGDYTPAQRKFMNEFTGMVSTVRDIQGVETVVKYIRGFKKHE